MKRIGNERATLRLPSEQAVEAAFKASWHASTSMSADDMHASLAAAYAVDRVGGSGVAARIDAALTAAEEWAAGYPLGGSMDRVAADDVLAKCQAARLLREDEPK